MVHRYALPLALMVAAGLDVLPLAWFICGLAWTLHISLDRALGYGLRTPDGFQPAR